MLLILTGASDNNISEGGFFTLVDSFGHTFYISQVILKVINYMLKNVNFQKKC